MVTEYLQNHLQNKFIVIAIDYLTKIVELDALKEKSAVNVGNFIYEKIILNHGCPNVILSDNGKEFDNILIKTLCARLSINKKFSSPYRPQTNGLVERTNQTLIGIIAKYVHKEGCEWDDCLPVIRFQYNIRPQENIGYSPFELLYGRKPNTPFLLNNEKRNENFMERIERINKRQVEVLEKRRKEQKLKTKERKTNFNLGDVVLYKNILRKGKLEQKWIGPYIVIKVSKTGSCKIKDIKSDKIILAHWNNLKPIYSEKDFKIEKEQLKENQEDLMRL